MKVPVVNSRLSLHLLQAFGWWGFWTGIRENDVPEQGMCARMLSDPITVLKVNIWMQICFLSNLIDVLMYYDNCIAFNIFFYVTLSAWSDWVSNVQIHCAYTDLCDCVFSMYNESKWYMKYDIMHCNDNFRIKADFSVVFKFCFVSLLALPFEQFTQVCSVYFTLFTSVSFV